MTEDYFNPIIEKNQDAENYGKDININEINELKRQKDLKQQGKIPQEEIEVIEEPKVIEEPIPPVIKKEIIKEFKGKIEKNPITKDHKLISKKTLTILIIALASFFLLFTIDMIWDNSIFADKDFSSDIMVNPVNNINVTDADLIENTYENEYTINNYNNITNIIVGVNSS